jgi:pheromone a factor receptor
MVDLAIGLGIPVLVMILHYIIQGHRFNILEDVGCFPTSYNTWPIFPIILLPPIIIGLFSATYAILTIIAFYKNNSQFNAILSSHGNNITSNRFIRLMCLASVEVIFNIPLAAYGISVQVHFSPLFPYISWENVHENFSRVDQFPTVIWRSNKDYEIAVELQRWAVVFCAVVFFIFFGFADEARKNYRSAFQSVAKRVGLSTGSSSYGTGINSSDYGFDGMKSKAIGSSGKIRPILPVFVHKEMLQRHNSMDSFSNMSIGDVSGALANNGPLSPTYSEKKLNCYPDLSYGGTKVNTDSLRLSSFPSSAVSFNSMASSITYPTPSRSRQDSGIEVSSVHRDSIYAGPNQPPTTSNPPSESSQPHTTK